MKTNLTVNLDHDDKVRCSNCEWTGIALDLKDVREIGVRLTPGETVPAGECPKCGALAHLAPGPQRGDCYRHIRSLIEAHVPVAEDLGDNLLGFAKTNTLSAIALMIAYHESTEPGLPKTRYDAVHGLLFAAVLCACEKIEPGPGTGFIAFDRLNDEQRAALQALLVVSDDMLMTTMDAVSVPKGLEAAALNPNMTKQ